MSYVGAPFAHDIFVSYSHGRMLNPDQISDLRAWSTAFVRELDAELRFDRKFADIRVFLDGDRGAGRGIDPMASLTDEIREHISASAILMVLMSDDYLASRWCREEREWWAQHHYQDDLVTARSGDTGLPAIQRIAVVRVTPTESAWPSLLLDSEGEQPVGFKLHAELAPGVVRPLGWKLPPEKFQASILEPLLDVVGRLRSKLDAVHAAIASRREQQAQVDKLAQPNGQVIYLHGRMDQAKAWERAGLALDAKGYSVLPGEPDAVENDPVSLQRVRERRVETLADCDAMILLGTEDGRALDSDLVVVGKHDRQSARSRSNRPLPCGLLDTVGAAVATPIRRATARNLQADWLDGTRPDWSDQVGRWLADKAQKAQLA